MFKKLMSAAFIGASSCAILYPVSATADPGEFNSVLVREFDTESECMAWVQTQSYYTWCRQNDNTSTHPGDANRVGKWQPR
ncbi:hypothetical protein [Nocardia sp. SSK8]|uniref:hypothetical protein n=1 Tax=Nocardia sp. SSK8 TaxID=3120154 RepID=UPI003009099B